jgi:uncharacterized protein
VEKIKLEILDLAPSQVQAGSFTLVLAESGGDTRMPIIIGMFEAQAIAIELEKIKPSRPLTHDLFKSFSNAFDFSIEEILISDIVDGVFYAKIISSDGIRQKNVDARPSDAIAIALRFNAPIYASQKVLDEAGVTSEDLGEKPQSQEPKAIKVKVSKSKSSGKLSDFSMDELNRFLNEALSKEEYEQAAKIRDEIDRRN